MGDWSFSIYDKGKRMKRTTNRHKVISVTGAVNIMRINREKKDVQPDFTDGKKNKKFKDILKETFKQRSI